MNLKFLVNEVVNYVGIILCIICTISSALGSIMIAELSAIYDIRQFKDLGKVLIGTNGEIFATIIQNGNFLLFLPIALDLVASAAQGVIDPNFDVCTDYFILGTAGICLLSTQVRSLGNADIMAVFSLICVFLVGILIVIISFDKDNDDKQHAQLFLNPMSHTMKGAVETLLGITTAAWSYVPSFIIIELRESLKTRRNMFKAIILSAILNMMFYIVVGTSVVVNWGWEMEDPVTILSVWPAKSFLGKFVNALLFIANLVSYSLDSVPLTNKFVKAVNPFFDMKSWNFRTVTRYESN
jgi:amino acid transporter